MNFSSKIIEWYKLNKRDLPWRKTKNPYKIWISEIILQQTQINQGLPYYNKFIIEFPNIFLLAQSDEKKILKLWQGLGYYSRARNLHFTAKYIATHLEGVFPKEYDNILKLKGIGEYTAAAIASFAFNKAHAVLDGNVFRVLSRYFNINTPINTSSGKKEFYLLANKLLDTDDPGTYNQAIMDFGSIQCKPRNPNCKTCILNIDCQSYNYNNQLKLPIKIKPKKKKKIYMEYFYIKNNYFLFLNKRLNNDIWKNLYDFPNIMRINKATKGEILKSIAEEYGNNFKIVKTSKIYIHNLTHKKIFARFWEIKFENLFNENLKKLEKINFNDLINYPIPRLIDKFLNDEKLIN